MFNVIAFCRTVVLPRCTLMLLVVCRPNYGPIKQLTALKGWLSIWSFSSRTIWRQSTLGLWESAERIAGSARWDSRGKELSHQGTYSILVHMCMYRSVTNSRISLCRVLRSFFFRVETSLL